MKKLKTLLFLPIICSLVYFTQSGCGVYSFNDVGNIPDSVKTVRVNLFDNRAPYINPQLSPNLTDRLKQKIVSQTRLTNTSNDAHYDISGVISDYSVSTSGVSSTGAAGGRQQANINRLTVNVNVTLYNQLTGQTQEFTVSRSFEFSASQSLQAAEAALLDEMIRNLTDEIFNRIFSNW